MCFPLFLLQAHRRDEFPICTFHVQKSRTFLSFIRYTNGARKKAFVLFKRIQPANSWNQASSKAPSAAAADVSVNRA